MLLKYFTLPDLVNNYIMITPHTLSLSPYCFNIKSLMAAVSGSEKASGPWYVSKHLSNEVPPSGKYFVKKTLECPELTIPVVAVIPVGIHPPAAQY